MAGPLLGIASQVYVTSPPSVAFTNEAMTDAGDHTTYTITNGAKRYLDRSVPVVVQTSPDGATWTTQAASTYSLHSAGGKVVWNSAQAAGTQTRLASGNYYPVAALLNVTEYTFDGENMLKEVTTMKGVGATPCKDFAISEASAKATVKRWSLVDSWLSDTLEGRVLVVLSLADPLDKRWEGYAWLDKGKLMSKTGDFVTEDLNFTFDGPHYYH